MDNLISICEDDEVLFGLACSLNQLIHLFGIKMSPLLEKLMSQEESTIRDKAVETYANLVSSLSSNQISSRVVPQIIKLSTQKKVNTKISMMNLITKIFNQVN